MTTSKNFFILLGIILLSLVFVLVAEYYFDVTPDYLEACTEEAKVCPDGSVVSRTGPNCEFAACPYNDDVVGSSSLPTVPTPDDHERPGEPDPVACTMDAKQCPDGSYVGRVGPDCEFAACPAPTWPINYGEDVSHMADYRADCAARGGVFNECGSACQPGVAGCAAVCSMLCERPVSDDKPSVEVDVMTCTPESRTVDACMEIYQPVCGRIAVECVTEPCDLVPQTFSNNCFACMNDRVVSYTAGACEMPQAQ